jgi:hypothetical protein
LAAPGLKAAGRVRVPRLAVFSEVLTMPTFTDDNGRKWTVDVNAHTIAAVREYDSEFLRGPAANTFERLADDPERLVNVLWILVEPQAVADDVEDWQFGRALAGSIERATNALVAAVLRFVRPDERRLLLRAAKKNKRARAKG